MLQLLGHPTTFGRTLFPEKGFFILAFVIISPVRCISRKKIASYIWGDAVPKKALSNLRYVLTKIRIWERNNKTKILDVTSRSISHANTKFQIDFEILLELKNSIPNEVLEQVIALYRGDLLEGFELSDEIGQTVLVSERQRILSHTIRITLEASKRTTGDLVERALSKLAQFAPTDEAILRARIQNLCLIGQRDSAKTLFRQFQTQLRLELGCEVEALTLNFASKMLPSVFSTPRTVLSCSTKPKLEPTSKTSELPRVLLLPPMQDPFNVVSEAELALAQGLVTEIIVLLGRMRVLAIIAPHTANQLGHLADSEAAHKTNADYIMSSTVFAQQKKGAHSSLTFTLKHSETDHNLLSEVVRLDHRNLSYLHAEISNIIANAISSHIKSCEIARFEATGISSAYILCVLGKQSLEYDLKKIRIAKRNFKNAARQMPTFSSAHALLARATTTEWLLLLRTDFELIAESTKHAQSAINLDPLNPLGHWELGHSKLYSNKLDESISDLETALMLAPNLADIIAEQADLFVHKGNGEKALRLMNKAISLNPIPPDSYVWTKGTAEFLCEDYENSLSTFMKMKNTSQVERLMAACAAMLGNQKLASRYRNKWMNNYPSFQLKDWIKTIPFDDPKAAQQFEHAIRSAGFY